jgi:hypothetical protein
MKKIFLALSCLVIAGSQIQKAEAGGYYVRNYYAPASVYCAPAPVVIYAQPPVVYRPTPVVVCAPPPVVVYRPRPVVSFSFGFFDSCAPRYYGGHYGGHHRRW